MIKTFLKLIILIAFFFGIWFVLTRVNWMKIFRIEQLTKNTEQKLGDLFWDMYKDKEILDSVITKPIDSILTRICDANDIDRSKIKLHVVAVDEINAFAMPDNHMVVNRGLINDAQNQGEIAGVIGHELAHIQEKHVMKKLIKEMGLSVLISIATGGGGGEVGEVARLLSSSAYDRKLEKEADIRAVDYLIKAKLDPEHLANFLYRLGDSSPDNMEYLAWVSSHPDSKERGEYIVNYSKGKSGTVRPILAESTWLDLKQASKTPE